MTLGVRQRAEQFVRPLYAGLDGVQTFDRVERLRRRVAHLAAGSEVDGDLLELLLLFHGVVDRLGSLAPGSRLDLFLRDLGLPDALARRVRAGLGRIGEDPKGLEEELLHDAQLLESAGVAAAAERLMALGKKRTPLAKALSQLDPGPPPGRYRTPLGATLGAARRQEAEEWIADLRRRIAAE
ncbi:MAG TPA: hypothetical protein VIA62_24585 [Thermoanaerobaculia bacterium]|jgi:hypothetical protein|nr:hypothetical protein [Thermoanaerobaculia bacterium]